MSKRNTRAWMPVLAAGTLILVTLGFVAEANAQNWCRNPIPPFEPPPPPPDPRCEEGEPDDPEESEEKCDKCKRSPCYVATGAFGIGAVDLDLPTAGFPLVAARTYQSTHHVDGPLGIGWTSGLTARLYHTTYLLALPNTVQKVAYTILPSGTRAQFEDNGDGTFTPRPGRHDDLVQNADGSFDLWLQRSLSSYHFGADGRLETMSDEYGNQLVYSYDGSGRLLRVEDASGSGRYLDVYWGADGRISNVVDSAGRQVGYTYNAEGMLTAVTDPVDQTTTYEYVEGRYAPLLAEVRDEWDRVVQTVTYDDQDRTTSYTDQGETYTYTYSYQDDPTLTAETDSSGNTWVYTHGEGGLVIQDQPPAGAPSRQTEYYPDGSIMLEIDEVGVKTFYTHDSEGRILTITRDYEGSEAARFDYEYDEGFPDRVASITPRNPDDDSVNPHWQAWQYDYYDDSSPAPGALYHVYRVRADGSKLDTLATFEYDARGRLTAALDGGGGRTDYLYDTQGNLATIQAPANNAAGIRPETHFDHDTVGRMTSVTDPLGRVTSLTYDAVDRLISVTLPPPEPGSPLAFTTTYTHDQYDAATDLTFSNITDPNGRVTKQGHDAYGRPVEIHNALDAVTHLDYANGLLASVTDVHGNMTSYTYDALRRLEQTTFPDGTVEIYTYHEDGILASKTDRKGQTIAYEHDALKRPTTKTYPGGASITYTYQGQKLTHVTDSSTNPDETHTFAYDDAYRVVSNVQGPRGTIGYAYTLTDRMTSMSVVGGPTTSYTYYPDQSVHTVQWTAEGGTFDFTYSLRGQYDTITFPDGLQRHYSFDDQGRLTQIANIHPASGTLATYAYGYDTNYFTGQSTMLGQRTSMVANVPAQGLDDAITKYYYDAAYQLVRTDYPSGPPFNGEVHEWTYDLLGNRLTSTVDGITATYTYQAAGGNTWTRLISDGTNTYTHDANGNMVTRSGPGGTYAFTWDAEDRLVDISGPDSASYAYDFWGRRLSKTTASEASEYLYNGFDLIAEMGTSPAAFIFGPDIDMPLALQRDGQVLRYGVDGLGTVATLANTAGTVLETYATDAWGVSRVAPAASIQPFGYTGREAADAGLWFYRTRYYAPATGSFIADDPLQYGGGDFNVRRYVSNNPILFIDPLGLARVCTRPIIFERDGAVYYAYIEGNTAYDALNWELLHEGLYYDDGSSSGYFGDSKIRPDRRRPTKCNPKHFDDEALRKAEEIVGRDRRWDQYNLLLNNCQDYVDEVLDEYDRIIDPPSAPPPGGDIPRFVP